MPSFLHFHCVMVGRRGCCHCSSNRACSCDWGLDASVVPAVLDGFGCDSVPSISHHKHGFKKVNFVYIVFISLVMLNGSKEISTAVVSLDTTNDSSVAGLNKRCEIQLEIFKVDILGFDLMKWPERLSMNITIL